MQEPIKYCSACGQPNNLSAQFCQRCGASDGAPPMPPAQSKASSPLVLVLSLVGVMFGCCAVSGIIGLFKNKNSHSPSVTLTGSPNAPGATWTTPTPNPVFNLTVVKSNWEKGGFGSIAMWEVTFKNTSDRPIGNIQYRTAYYSETGNLVDKGGIDSPLDKKIIQKVIPPKSTRTIEINDGFLNSQAHRASFEVVGCEFVTDGR